VFVKKVFLKKNMEEQANYGKEYEDKSVEDFWENVFFTGEARVNSTFASCGEYLMREGKAV